MKPCLTKVSQGLKHSLSGLLTQCGREDLEDAVEADDEASLEGLRDQLTAFVEVLDAAFIKKKIPERTQIWVQVRMWKCGMKACACVCACLREGGALSLCVCHLSIFRERPMSVRS